jgi:membrane protease YdiL (CAAX protease family)
MISKLKACLKTEKDKLFVSWSSFQLAVVSLAFSFAVYLFLVDKVALAVAFASYGAILVQSRLRLWQLIRGFPGAPALRRLIRSAVFALPLPFLGLPVLKSSAWGVLAGCAYGIFFLFWRFSELRLNLSAEFIAILPPLSKEDKFREIAHLILGAIAQEYFYRGAILHSLSSYLGVWSIAVATLLFVLEHLMHFDASQAFDGRDYLFHVLMSLGLGVIFYYSKSLAGCMVGHVIYNSPGAIQALRRKSL